MFERYTEAARRTIFAARNAAFPDSKYIETHHLLLGLIHTVRRCLRACWVLTRLLPNYKPRLAAPLK